MDLEGILHRSFLDELEKIAVSRHRMSVPQSRSGRRPVSVANLLKKEKDGTLYNETGSKDKIAALGENAVPFVGGDSRPRKKGETPSRDTEEGPKREDSRGNAATIHAPGVTVQDVAVSNTDTA